MQRIGEILIRGGAVKADDVEKAVQIQKTMGGRIGAILVRMGAVSEDTLLVALSDQLGLQVLGVSGLALPDDLIVYNFLKESNVNLDWFIDNQLVLWGMDGNEVGCLSRDPSDNFVNQALGYFYPEKDIKYFLCRNYDLEKIINYLGRERAVENLFQNDQSRQSLMALAEEAPVIELVNNIISQAIDVGASDIHVEPQQKYFSVRLRVDGVLRQQMMQPIERFPAVASRIKLISGIDIAERRLPQDGRFSTRVSGAEIDVRVSSAPEVNGESIVLRLLPKQRDDLSLLGLGMEPDHLALMRKWAVEAHGIVLVTGPTGSGKSTTLYSMLEESNSGDRKIITVEDPVEYQVEGITQIQAHSEIGYTFSKALRAILRQDPDVIMIGEIRDLETAEIAIQSALTGHLVLSTLHTNDAVSSFVRLIDMGIEPFLVAAPLRGVQAQRLVRKICKYCSQSTIVPEMVLDKLKSVSFESNNWLKAVGCARCQGTGYKGRMGIYELIDVNADMQALIARNAPLLELRQLAAEQGFRTLLQDGLLKASCGLTTVEEVYRVVEH